MTRTPGSTNKVNDYPRNKDCSHFRCTEGFNTIIEQFIESGLYKSKSDVMHQALFVLASANKNFFWQKQQAKKFFENIDKIL